ncbi:hypothetical protein GUY40_19740 [Pseudomonas sp. R5(2019)]|nr:hypothetical protein [Pseudomonas sp. R5(2019)]NBA97150.1 hypothetical protein [Pseudomonas sp. R5(2019)]
MAKRNPATLESPALEADADIVLDDLIGYALRRAIEPPQVVPMVNKLEERGLALRDSRSVGDNASHLRIE